MTLDNICTLFDSYYIAEKRSELNTKYIASSELIYSDGQFNHRINSDGYITIDNVKDAEYIIFIDQNGDVFIAIYKYIYDLKFKDIITNVNKIRSSTGMRKHSIVSHEDTPNKIIPSGNVIDVNNFKCSVCNNDLEFSKLKNATVLAVCKKCNVEYALVPSKYYILKAKKQIYESDDSLNINP